ncbi:MAG: ferritin-like domain-containing protein [Myxococcales bacterium]|nr:ferritin-like domain-containing protein [Myxococcales bacterium]
MAAEGPSFELVRAEWRRRVEAEYASACITQELVLWLMQIAASPDLIESGLEVVKDELAHAELSMQTYLAAGGTTPPVLDRARLCLPRTPGAPLEHDVLRACVDVFCLGETVAVPLFKNLREGCTEPNARAVMTRVLRDEVRHRDFGWTMLPWLFELPVGEELRAIVERELPVWFRRVRTAYGATAGRAVGADRVVDDSARAWGLMEISRYAAVVEETFEREWKPRFHEVGVDAERAWRAAVG